MEKVFTSNRSVTIPLEIKGFFKHPKFNQEFPLCLNGIIDENEYENILINFNQISFMKIWLLFSLSLLSLINILILSIVLIKYSEHTKAVKIIFTTCFPLIMLISFYLIYKTLKFNTDLNKYCKVLNENFFQKGDPIFFKSSFRKLTIEYTVEVFD
eukprot:TRINITY_DN15343_c0_g1_i1.p1 TRINITY_DN15343_c0_g1~~TRINITY_DN15343_c0_g1_i1.p1  ORF type:complete len:156 (+),score=13.54 TRINITY_DN15343_c0_g1_i1:1-468(+)